MMKLSVAVAGEHALESAFVVWRGFEDSMRRAAMYGYDGVELALKRADEIPAAVLRTLLAEYHLEVSCISTGQVFADTGLYFTHPDASMRKAAVKVFQDLICLASEFGNMVNIGRIRGCIAPGESAEETEKRFLETMGAISAIAENYGVELVIEPVNRYEINFINNVDEGAELIRKLGAAHIGLMPDVFHMNIEDAQIGEALIRNQKDIRYIHFADSNRLAPGWGHLDFEEVFDALAVIGYSGWASVEILPKPSPDEAARQAIGYLRPLMGRR